MDAERTYRWRGLAGPSLEALRLTTTDEGVVVRSDVVDIGPAPFAVSYDWTLDPSWRTRSLKLHIRAQNSREMSIERAGEASWRVDGVARTDLDGCEEVDLSVTPFCNTLALRRFGPPPGGAGELTVAYVDFPALGLGPSRQRYERLGPDQFRYVDLGRYAGFEAVVSVDPDGLVQTYEGLFERVG